MYLNNYELRKQMADHTIFNVPAPNGLPIPSAASIATTLAIANGVGQVINTYSSWFSSDGKTSFITKEPISPVDPSVEINTNFKSSYYEAYSLDQRDKLKKTIQKQYANKVYACFAKMKEEGIITPKKIGNEEVYSLGLRVGLEIMYEFGPLEFTKRFSLNQQMYLNLLNSFIKGQIEISNHKPWILEKLEEYRDDLNGYLETANNQMKTLEQNQTLVLPNDEVLMEGLRFGSEAAHTLFQETFKKMEVTLHDKSLQQKRLEQYRSYQKWNREPGLTYSFDVYQSIGEDRFNSFTKKKWMDLNEAEHIILTEQLLSLLDITLLNNLHPDSKFIESFEQTKTTLKDIVKQNKQFQRDYYYYQQLVQFPSTYNRLYFVLRRYYERTREIFQRRVLSQKNNKALQELNDLHSDWFGMDKEAHKLTLIEIEEAADDNKEISIELSKALKTYGEELNQVRIAIPETNEFPSVQAFDEWYNDQNQPISLKVDLQANSASNFAKEADEVFRECSEFYTSNQAVEEILQKSENGERILYEMLVFGKKENVDPRVLQSVAENYAKILAQFAHDPLNTAIFNQCLVRQFHLFRKNVAEGIMEGKGVGSVTLLEFGKLDAPSSGFLYTSCNYLTNACLDAQQIRTEMLLPEPAPTSLNWFAQVLQIFGLTGAAIGTTDLHSITDKLTTLSSIASTQDYNSFSLAWQFFYWGIYPNFYGIGVLLTSSFLFYRVTTPHFRSTLFNLLYKTAIYIGRFLWYLGKGLLSLTLPKYFSAPKWKWGFEGYSFFNGGNGSVTNNYDNRIFINQTLNVYQGAGTERKQVSEGPAIEVLENNYIPSGKELTKLIKQTNRLQEVFAIDRESEALSKEFSSLNSDFRKVLDAKKRRLGLS